MGASVEVVTGRRLVLFVILSTSRWLRACGARGFLLKSELAHTDLAGYWPASGA
jgi:hypothetical protein